MKMKFKGNKGSLKVLKAGGYTVVVSAVVLVIVVVLNLAVGKLPNRFTKFSISNNGEYNISSVSREFIKGVKEDVTVYVVAEEGSEDAPILEYVERYTGLSGKLHTETVDPARRPGFLDQYTDQTLNAAQTNLVVVNENNGRSRVIPYTSIYVSQYSQEELYYYYYLYGYMPDNPTYFDIEQRLTSALDYVTMEKLPTVYYTSGHGEYEVDSGMKTLFENENIALSELDMKTTEEIPADADALIICLATMDFTEQETEKLNAYVDQGGTVLLISQYDIVEEGKEKTLPENLYAFAEGLGLSYEDKLVHEGDTNRVDTYYGPLYLNPTLTENSYSAAVPSNTRLIMYYCHAIHLAEDAPESVTLSELMSTSVKGYAKTEIKADTSVEKAEGDEEGSFCVAAMAEKTTDKGTGRLVWFASPAIFDSGTVGYYSNYSYLMAVLSQACEKGESISIDPTLLSQSWLNVSDSASNIWGVLLIGVVPVTVLAVGFGVWAKRRNR